MAASTSIRRVGSSVGSPNARASISLRLVSVIKPGTMRTVLTIAANKQWPVNQLDISNTFLHVIFKNRCSITNPSGSWMNPSPTPCVLCLSPCMGSNRHLAPGSLSFPSLPPLLGSCPLVRTRHCSSIVMTINLRIFSST
jgi:hypothetical protein